MVVKYNIAGRQVGSHILAIGVLGTISLGIGIATSGGKKATAASPPINASSKDEETFIQDFLKAADGDEKAKH
ncbi:hypothetical protein UCRPC4_g01284 [Phaeomoniella chlamydospora]|uniref:ATP synthase subunit K n=1 Tax=Phaeomoniella chlamydospora TaxID=158046 RepID=A0A0G2EY13_PHACM|nr:hypothetical protein UCRPC4_g01284 [Phaeomoniella chlamydospora]